MDLVIRSFSYERQPRIVNYDPVSTTPDPGAEADYGTDSAILGGFTTAHQFVRIGAHSFTSMGAYLSQDLPPYVMAAGNMAKPYGINSKGLQRRGFSADVILRIKRAYRTLYRSGLSLAEARQALGPQAADCSEVVAFLEFVARSERGCIH